MKMRKNEYYAALNTLPLCAMRCLFLAIGIAKRNNKNEENATAVK